MGTLQAVAVFVLVALAVDTSQVGASAVRRRRTGWFFWNNDDEDGTYPAVPEPPPPPMFYRPIEVDIGSENKSEIARIIFHSEPSQPFILTNFREGHLVLSHLDKTVLALGCTSELAVNKAEDTLAAEGIQSPPPTRVDPLSSASIKASLSEDLLTDLLDEKRLVDSEDADVPKVIADTGMTENEFAKAVEDFDLEDQDQNQNQNQPTSSNSTNTTRPTLFLQLEQQRSRRVHPAPVNLRNPRSFFHVDRVNFYAENDLKQRIDSTMAINSTLLVVGNEPVWSTVANDDFEFHADGWSSQHRQTCANSNVFLGGYCKFAETESSKTYTDLPPHHFIRVSANYHFFDRWLGEWAYLKLDGNVVWTENHHHCPHIFSHLCSGISVCGDGDVSDRLSTLLSVTFPHTANSTTLVFGSTLTDEVTNSACLASWGVDDVTIDVLYNPTMV